MKKISICTVLALAVTTIFLTIGCYDTGTLAQKDCVVMLGDSIFALSGEETGFLQELSGQKYRTYYIVGAQIGDPTRDDLYGGCDLFDSVETIPEQYVDAKRDDPNIRTIIYDGGGNDVLLGGADACSTSYPNGQISAECNQIIEYVEGLNNALWEDMAADGVENIVQQGYYLSTDKKLWVVADLFQNRTIAEWNTFKAGHPEINMVYVDPRTNDHFDRSKAASYTIIDGIHPNTASSEVLANMLWDAMVANGIEQTDECAGSDDSPIGCN